MPLPTYSFTAELWLYPGGSAWHFATLPKKLAAEIKELFGDAARGWGSLPVRVTLGKSTWKTSIFPDKNSASYVLPVKAAVRKAEGVEAGDKVGLRIELLV